MKYKNSNREDRVAKLSLDDVTSFIPAPDLVGIECDQCNDWVRKASSTFRVKDVGAYIRRSLNRGECILTKEKKRGPVTVVCTWMTVTVDVKTYRILNVLHSK